MDLDETKIIGMVTLGIGSFLTGILPAWLSPLTRQRCPLFLSCLLCWGGGVLLATSLLHMLPEARETVPEFAELSLCVGFFIIYFVDELVHFFYGNRIENRRQIDTDANVEDANRRHDHHGHSHQPDRSQYGACESSSLINPNHSRDGAPFGENQNNCHMNHEEPCTRSSAGSLGLLLALLLHAILEGLAIGLETVSEKVLLLVGAVASHKLVVGFCLGIELSATGRGKICTHIVSILIFSLGSVVGIGAGMLVEESKGVWTKSTLGILQSLAAGTLLYVTVSEVLPRERAKWHQNKRHSGLLQLFATLFGFVLMFLLSRYLDADH